MTTIVRKGVALVLMCLTLFAIFAAPIAASGLNVKANVSRSAVEGNLNNSAFPAGIGVAQRGENLYINFSSSTDHEFDICTIYLANPGESEFHYAGKYDPTGYFRYCFFQFTPIYTGTYQIRIEITTMEGATYYAIMPLNVEEPTQTTNSTYQFNGATYSIVENFKDDYVLNQYDYPRFVNPSQVNTGCTATAMVMCYNITNNCQISPNDVIWDSAGCRWEYSKSVAKAGTYSQEEAFKIIYDEVITNKRPVIVGISDFSHTVVVVGVRDGASRKSLSMSDFLIADPAGGDISLLSEFSGIDTGWSLRVSID